MEFPRIRAKMKILVILVFGPTLGSQSLSRLPSKDYYEGPNKDFYIRTSHVHPGHGQPRKQTMQPYCAKRFLVAHSG